jgi:hypothetical protein
MVENEQHKKQLMGVFFFARKKGRKALADIAAAAAATKTIIKTHTRFLTWTTYTQEDNRR